MKICLTAVAAHDYLDLTLRARQLGIIGRSHFEARLRALLAMAHANDLSANIAREQLRGSDAVDDEAWDDDPSPGQAEQGDDLPRTAERAFDPGAMAFRILIGRLKDWVFHQADDDFFPSVPHGHFHGQVEPKLDAYLGWVYRRTRQVDRLARDVIIDLWNDDGFRAFAAKAIDYYVRAHPAFRWRVAKPRKLPARRR